MRCAQSGWQALITATCLLSIPLTAIGQTADSRAASEKTVPAWAEDHLGELVEIYRWFHQHPEISFQEQQTAERFAEHLHNAGYDVTTGIGGHGVVALLRNGDGPTLMLRTDLDGLPVAEQTRLVYASRQTTKNPDGHEVGVMHACGHDVHITNLIGTARYLATHRDQWQGTLMVIGQPAEERGAGAAAMLADGLFDRFPKPDFALALHVDSNLEAGKVALREGYSLANVDSVDIVVMGRGGHGAYPHTTIDPIVQAAQLILALQTIVSREVPPTEPAVITVGAIHAGTKHNIISDRCHLQLTVRSYSDQVRKQLLDAIARKAKGIAQTSGAEPPEITVSEGTPSLWNDPKLTRQVRAVLQDVLGPDNVVEADLSMGGEDFSQFGKAGVPILMMRLGSVQSQRMERFRQLEQPPPSLHSPLYYPDAEPTLRTGLIATTRLALALLAPASDPAQETDDKQGDNACPSASRAAQDDLP